MLGRDGTAGAEHAYEELIPRPRCQQVRGRGCRVSAVSTLGAIRVLLLASALLAPPPFLLLRRRPTTVSKHRL